MYRIISIILGNGQFLPSFRNTHLPIRIPIPDIHQNGIGRVRSYCTGIFGKELAFRARGRGHHLLHLIHIIGTELVILVMAGRTERISEIFPRKLPDAISARSAVLRHVDARGQVTRPPPGSTDRTFVVLGELGIVPAMEDVVGMPAQEMNVVLLHRIDKFCHIGLADSIGPVHITVVESRSSVRTRYRCMGSNDHRG